MIHVWKNVGSTDEVSLTFSASYLYEKLVSDIDWYHGELSEIEAEKALRDCQDSNCFLIRESEVSLILSLIHHEEVYHTTIEHEPGQYRLEGEPPEKTFTKLDYLVSHYRSKALHIEPKTILGVACEKTEHATGINKLKITLKRIVRENHQFCMYLMQSQGHRTQKPPLQLMQKYYLKRSMQPMQRYYPPTQLIQKQRIQQ